LSCFWRHQPELGYPAKLEEIPQGSNSYTYLRGQDFIEDPAKLASGPAVSFLKVHQDALGEA